MKKYLKIFAVLALAFGVSACKCSSDKQEETAAATEQSEVMESEITIPAEPVFEIITSLGTIKVKLYEDTPLHRDNFVKLARSGYFNGMLFHRVINGFMIQGGDPLSKDESQREMWGTGGPGYTIPAEILPNHSHKKGALAAARRGDAANPARESSGSQFYLVQDEGNCAQLDGAYTVFGETLEGLDVIDKIAAVDRDRRDRPNTPVRIVSVKLAE